jgi:hypothetical protein
MSRVCPYDGVPCSDERCDTGQGTACLDQEFESVRAEEREECAKIAEWDSVLDWVGGSTGNAKGTAKRIAAAIRNRKTP